MIFRRPVVEDNPSAKTQNPPVPGRQELAAPVTNERLAAELKRHNYAFTQDEDGDLTGVWDDHQFWFILGGNDHEVLQIRGRWNGTLSSSERVSALLTVNDWNRDHIWPKVYLRDEGEIVIYAEVSIDFEYGVTDSQLREAIACGLVTAVQFFTSMSNSLVATLGLE